LQLPGCARGTQRLFSPAALSRTLAPAQARANGSTVDMDTVWTADMYRDCWDRSLPVVSYHSSQYVAGARAGRRALR
jgi:hypothetical protein